MGARRVADAMLSTYRAPWDAKTYELLAIAPGNDSKSIGKLAADATNRGITLTPSFMNALVRAELDTTDGVAAALDVLERIKADDVAPLEETYLEIAAAMHEAQDDRLPVLIDDALQYGYKLPGQRGSGT